MAVVDATLSTDDFSSDVGFSLFIGGTSESYAWRNAAETPDLIIATGTGFTYGADPTIPTGGTVTAISMDNAWNSSTDFVISDISVNLPDLIDTGDYAASSVKFWQTVMSGNDTILAPLTQGGRLTGDFTSVVSTVFNTVSLAGGDDTFNATSTIAQGVVFSRGDGTSTNALVGDALLVDGASFSSIANFGFLAGGADIFNVSGKSPFAVVGDAQAVGELGAVTGGDDVVNSTLNFISLMDFGAGTYFGDVELNFGLVIGGNDTINGSNFAFTVEYFAGDVNRNTGTGTTTGGADKLLGRAGQEFMAGDVLRMEGGSLTGGADTIRGGEDSDIIAGDAFRSVGAGQAVAAVFTLSGGADKLFGDNGNDWIVGDMWDAGGVDAASSIVGGNDLIFGGDGDDTLYGDIGGDFIGLLDSGGNDTIDGGLGDDLIDGQLGIDTASFASVAAAVVVDLQAGVATGQGSDTLVAIENVTGSSLADTLRGDGGNNILRGGDGGDTLVGRDGNDTLAGGDGADTMSGGAGLDVFLLDADGDTDTMNGGAGVDALDLSAATANTTVNLNAGTVSGGGFGADQFTGIEFVAGSNNSGLVDTVKGGAAAEIFFLRAGDDVATGGGGGDSIAGEQGNDSLDGGTGDDILNGGTGADTFNFSTVLNAATNVDTIEDFGLGADGIALDSAVFTGLAAGNLGGAAFFAGSGAVAAHDASDRIVYDTDTGALYFDSDGLGGAAAVQFATLQGGPVIGAGDFVIV